MKVNKKWIRWALLGIITISFIASYTAVFDPKPDLNGDNFHYFFLAQSLAAGHGYVNEMGPVVEPHLHFPPGYPAFMSLFLHFFPGDIIAMKILNGILMLLSILLLFRIIRKTAGPLGVWIAFVGCMLCTVHPELLRWATIMMSEMLYLAVSLGIINLCLDLDVDKAFQGDWRNILRLVGLCLLVAFTYFIRTMGISVVLAVALSFFVLGVKQWKRRKESGRSWIRNLAVCGLVIVSLAIAWESWNLRNQVVAPGSKSEYLNNFAYKRDGSEMKTLDDWTTRVDANLNAFTAFYIPGSIIRPTRTSDTMMPAPIKASGWVIGILLIAVMVIGILSLEGISLLVLVYFLITFGVLMLYQQQYAGTRYFVPLMPLMLCALAAGLVRIADWVRRLWTRRPQKWLGILALIALFAVAYPFYIKDQKGDRNIAAVKSYLNIKGNDQLKQFVQASDWFLDHSTNKVLVSCRKPEVFHFFSGFRHTIPLPPDGTPEEVIEYLKERKVDAIIMDCWFPQAYRIILPAAQKYPEVFPGVAQFGEVTEKGHATFILLFKPPVD